MTPFSLEDFFLSSRERASPGGQLYLYRLLQLIASGEKTGDALTLSYGGARELAVRLGLGSTEKLAGLFRDLGMGEMKVQIDPEAIAVTLKRDDSPEMEPSVREAACEMERGIIDGALQLISGIPVTTSETYCSARGHKECRFEAVIDSSGDIPRYIPGPADNNSTGGSPPSSGNGFSLSKIRSWYMDLAARELARSRRHSRPLTVVYLDLDDLGRINAEHGRKAGDQVINAVSAALSRSCRAEDFLWHTGEDEFALILAETDSEEGDVVARRLTTAIFTAAENIEFAAKISASIGFSSFPEHAEDLNTLLESARSALYLAKASGKGRAQVAVKDFPQEGLAGPKERREEAAEPKEEEYILRRSPAEDEEKIEETELEAAERQVSVVIAMSSQLLMAGIRQIISSEEGIEILEAVTEPSMLPDMLEDIRPELIIADMAMALNDDFAALRMIREENLPCKFIVFADVIDQEVIKVAADFGIDGIILQSASPKEIVTAIGTVYKGQSVIPEEAKTAMKDLESKRQLLDELSERELDVLKLVAEGKSNSQISEELYITVNTVRFHLANIYQKLNVSNRTEAANCYLKQDRDSDKQTRLL